MRKKVKRQTTKTNILNLSLAQYEEQSKQKRRKESKKEKKTKVEDKVEGLGKE